MFTSSISIQQSLQDLMYRFSKAWIVSKSAVMMSNSLRVITSPFWPSQCHARFYRNRSDDPLIDLSSVLNGGRPKRVTNIPGIPTVKLHSAILCASDHDLAPLAPQFQQCCLHNQV